jgi:hypothetical protein
MAKMKRPIGDMVSGKVGNVVFFVWDGESYVRAAPERKKTEWTPDQQLHRQRFSQASKLWREVKSAQVQQIWNLGAKKMNGYAFFMKANMPAFALDGSLMDFRMLQLSTGKLNLPQEFQAHRVAEESSTIAVGWQNDPLLKGVRLHDELMVVSSYDGKFSLATPTGIERGQRNGTFELPPRPDPHAPSPLHLYLFFASANRSAYSESVCCEV